MFIIAYGNVMFKLLLESYFEEKEVCTKYFFGHLIVNTLGTKMYIAYYVHIVT